MNELNAVSPYTSYLLHIAPTILGGIFAGGVAWGTVRWEQRSMRRAMRRVEKSAAWAIHTLIVLSQAHNDNHPDSERINLGELSTLLHETERASGIK